MTEKIHSTQYVQYDKGQFHRKNAEITDEAPVILTLNGDIWLTFMCTPIDLENLAIGFLYNEGVIQSIDEIASIHVCSSGLNIDLWLNHGVDKPKQWSRTTGCTGGFTSTDINSAIHQDQIPNNLSLTPEQVREVIESLSESQDLYRRAGGIHTSVLSDGHKVVVIAEDIGRHNTLDKIAGHCLKKRIQLSGWILATTGRISSEMLQKASRLGASIVISRTSPSMLSIQIAEQWGITLIGYAKRSSFRIYTHPERILLFKNFNIKEAWENYV